MNYKELLEKPHYDYPTKPIGGSNPYYCCTYCEKSDPSINGRLDGHYDDCVWAKAKKYAIINDIIRLYLREIFPDVKPKDDLMDILEAELPKNAFDFINKNKDQMAPVVQELLSVLLTLRNQ